MLLSKDVIVDVLEWLWFGDFYCLVYQNVYDVILDLYGWGELVDVVMVVVELDCCGLLCCIGGVFYLYILILMVLMVVNVGYYVSIVVEKVLLCWLVEVGIWVVQYGYVGVEGVDVVEVVDCVQVEIYDVVDWWLLEDFVVFEDLL